jgi:hypothetical protein
VLLKTKFKNLLSPSAFIKSFSAHPILASYSSSTSFCANPLQAALHFGTGSVLEYEPGFTCFKITFCLQ